MDRTTKIAGLVVVWSVEFNKSAKVEQEIPSSVYLTGILDIISVNGEKPEGHDQVDVSCWSDGTLNDHQAWKADFEAAAVLMTIFTGTARPRTEGDSGNLSTIYALSAFGGEICDELIRLWKSEAK